MARFSATFTVSATAGPVSIPGLRVGDVVLHVIDSVNGSESGGFASVVVVDDELIQFNGEPSVVDPFFVVVSREVMV